MVNLFPGALLSLILAGKPFEKASGIVYSQYPTVKMESWSIGVLEYWGKRTVGLLFFFSIIPTLHYSTTPD
jgi:hypothetical protein